MKKCKFRVGDQVDITSANERNWRYSEVKLFEIIFGDLSLQRWRGKIYEDPPWKRLMTSILYFVVGLPKLAGAVTGVYCPEAAVPLYCRLLCLETRIEKFLGTYEPGVGRIVDPRLRAFALEAVWESRRLARAKGAGRSGLAPTTAA